MIKPKETEQMVVPTVFLVENDGPLLEFFAIILRRDGYTILEAVNGREALDIAESCGDDRIDVLHQ